MNRRNFIEWLQQQESVLPPPPPPPSRKAHDFTPGTLLLKIQSLRQSYGEPLYVRTHGGHELEVLTQSIGSHTSGNVPTIKGQVPETSVAEILNKDGWVIQKVGSAKSLGPQTPSTMSPPPPPPPRRVA